jgi:hypothetical protein
MFAPAYMGQSDFGSRFVHLVRLSWGSHETGLSDIVNP